MPAERESTDRILAVIVLYHFSFGESAACNSFRQNPELSNLDILVWSNRPQAEGLENLRVTYSKHAPDNPGVTTAYQYAFQLALEKGYTRIWLLDEDTTIPPGTFDQYTQAIQSGSGIIAPQVYDQRGLLSPFRFNGARGFRLPTPPTGEIPLRQFRAINSGTMIQVSLLGMVDGFPVGYPLDFSDIVLQERLSRVCPTLTVIPATLLHRFSGSEKGNFASALHRFMLYCSAGRRFASESGTKIKMSGFLLLRAIHLSWQYRSLRFLTVAFNTPS